MTSLTKSDYKDEKEIFITRFGKKQVVADFVVLLKLKDSLIDLFSSTSTAIMSISHLKESLSTISAPILQEMPLFMTFPTVPGRQNDIEDCAENQPIHSDFEL